MSLKENDAYAEAVYERAQEMLCNDCGADAVGEDGKVAPAAIMENGVGRTVAWCRACHPSALRMSVERARVIMAL